MDERELARRTRAFALPVIALTEALPRGRVADVIGRQLLRSGTSGGANYSAAWGARFTAELAAKLGVVEEELVEEAGQVAAARVEELKSKTHQLLSINVASIETAREAR